MCLLLVKDFGWDLVHTVLHMEQGHLKSSIQVKKMELFSMVTPVKAQYINVLVCIIKCIIQVELRAPILCGSRMVDS
jgi:hypothetical protein